MQDGLTEVLDSLGNGQVDQLLSQVEVNSEMAMQTDLNECDNEKETTFGAINLSAIH